VAIFLTGCKDDNIELNLIKESSVKLDYYASDMPFSLKSNDKLIFYYEGGLIMKKSTFGYDLDSNEFIIETKEFDINGGINKNKGKCVLFEFKADTNEVLMKTEIITMDEIIYGKMTIRNEDIIDTSFYFRGNDFYYSLKNIEHFEKYSFDVEVRSSMKIGNSEGLRLNSFSYLLEEKENQYQVKPIFPRFDKGSDTLFFLKKDVNLSSYDAVFVN